MIYTGIPFGYAIIYGFLFVCILLGLVLVGVAIRRRSILIGLAGVMLCISSGGVLIVDTLAKSSMDWNPRIESDIAVMGSWVAKDKMLILNTDHSFSYNVGPTEQRGTWTRDDWNLYLHSAAHRKLMRVIQDGASLRIMTDPPDDPDAWNGDRGLKRVSTGPESSTSDSHERSTGRE